MPRRWYQRPPARLVTIDRDARDEMAALVRTLATRRMGIASFENQAIRIARAKTDDPALFETYFYLAELLDGVRSDTMPKVPRELRRVFARIILFLRSDEAYCWMPGPGERNIPHWPTVVGDALLWLIAGLKVPVIGLIGLALRVLVYFTPDWVAPRRPVHQEREEAWPFPDVAALRRAESEVTLLRGLPCV